MVELMVDLMIFELFFNQNDSVSYVSTGSTGLCPRASFLLTLSRVCQL